MTSPKPKEPGLFGKLGDLFGSMRFWFVTASTVSAIVANPENTPEILTAYFAAVAAIGTLDSVATKISSKKAE